MVWDNKSASIFFNSNFSGMKVNLVGAFGRSKFKIPKFLKTTETTNKKLRKNGNFYVKLVFGKSILVFGVTHKKMTIDTNIFTECLC